MTISGKPVAIPMSGDEMEAGEQIGESGWTDEAMVRGLAEIESALGINAAASWRALARFVLALEARVKAVEGDVWERGARLESEHEARPALSGDGTVPPGVSREAPCATGGKSGTLANPACARAQPSAPLEPRELLCMRCGKEHPIWSADSGMWNATVRREGVDEYPFLCATCFMVLAEERGVASMFFVSAEQPMSSRLGDVIRYLLGEGGLDGAYFGDEAFDKERRIDNGRYWWRSLLREAFAAASAPSEQQGEREGCDHACYHHEAAPRPEYEPVEFSFADYADLAGAGSASAPSQEQPTHYAYYNGSAVLAMRRLTTENAALKQAVEQMRAVVEAAQAWGSEEWAEFTPANEMPGTVYRLLVALRALADKTEGRDG